MRVILTAFLILVFATAAQAASVSAVTVPITAAGVPAGSNCYDIQVTSTGDILGMQIVSIGGALYNEPVLGSDLKPNPALFPGFPALEFDSWVDLPTTGTISILAGTLGVVATAIPTTLPMDYVDLTNDGAQSNFTVARLTLLPGVTLLPSFQTAPVATNLVVATQEDVGGVPTIVTWYNVPEPATMSLLALGGLAALRRRR